MHLFKRCLLTKCVLRQWFLFTVVSRISASVLKYISWLYNIAFVVHHSQSTVGKIPRVSIIKSFPAWSLCLRCVLNDRVNLRHTVVILRCSLEGYIIFFFFCIICNLLLENLVYLMHNINSNVEFNTWVLQSSFEKTLASVSLWIIKGF